MHPVSIRQLYAAKNFRSFWLARSLSFVGDQVAQTALVIAAARVSPQSVVIILLAFTVPRLLGPACGALADLYPMRTLMLAMDGVQGALFLSLAVLPLPIGVVAGIVALATLANTVFLPAGRKSYPRFVSKELFPAAARAMGTSFTMGFAIGPAIGGGLTELLGPRPVLSADALSFVLSAILISRTPKMIPGVTPGPRISYLRALSAGIAAIRTSPALRSLLPAFAALIAVAAFDNAALPLLAHTQLPGPEGVYGYILSAYGIGMIGGSMLGDRIGGAAAPIRSWALSQAVFGVGTLLTGIGPVLWLVFAGQILAGVGNGAGIICVDIVLQREVSPEVLGAANGVSMSIPFVSSAITYLVAGFLLHLLRPSVLLIAAGGAVFVVLLVALPRLQAIERAREVLP